MVKEESVTTANEKVLNKVNPNEFDPLQEKEKKADEIRKEQNSHGDTSAKEPTSIQPSAVPAAKTPNSQMNEYYGPNSIYGLY